MSARRGGWSIELTGNWDKYGCVDESEFAKKGLVHFRYEEVYKTGNKYYHGKVFTIGTMTVQEFNDWSDMDAPVPQMIAERDGTVYYYTTPNWLEVDNRDADFEREWAEYKLLADDIPEMIKTFQFVQ